MTRDDARRGAVLVVVLWCVALLSALAMAASVTFRGFAGILSIDRDRTQTQALLTAGVEAAASLVATLRDVPFREFGSSVALSTGSVRMTLSDEGGRIDLFRAPFEVLAGLFRTIGMPDREAADVAERLIAWRNYRAQQIAQSGDVVPPSGSEFPFSGVRELLQLAGMSPGWFDAVAPLVTIYGGPTINPLTAPAAVIAALPGMNQPRLQAFLNMRDKLPIDSAQLGAALGAAQQFVEVKPQRNISIYLEANLADGFAAAARTVIVVLPGDTEPYRVLAWTPVPSAPTREASVCLGILSC